MQLKNSRSNIPAQTAQTQPGAAQPARKSIDFVLQSPQAQSVAVAGTFNGWNPKRTPMRKDGNGEWKATLSLPPGRYEYRFVLDGTQWVSDEHAKESVANAFGGTNSVIVV